MNLITDRLITYFDLKDNDLSTIVSKYSYDKAKTSNLKLDAAQLTLYDIGRTNYLSGSSLVLSSVDNRLKLHRMAYNVKKDVTDKDNSISFEGLELSMLNNTNFGNFIRLAGGYLGNFFKLEGYQHELLPYRYLNGYSIEVPLKIDINNTNGNSIFLFLGQRAENKYNLLFEGSEENCDYETTFFHDNCLNGETDYRTSLDNKLGSDLDASSLDNNVYAFFITSDFKIGLRYIKEGNVYDIISNNSIKCTDKWNTISIVFKPNEKINVRNNEDIDKILKCSKIRKGFYNIYVNGSEFFSFEIEEFFFKGLNTQKEKQISVPYFLSWGGGSFGLKHSYHNDPYWQKLFTNMIDFSFNGNFFNLDGLKSFGSNQLITSIDRDVTTISNAVIQSDDLDVFTIGNSELPFYTDNSSLIIFNNEGIGEFTINDTPNLFTIGGYQPIEDNLILFESDRMYNLESEKKYILSLKVYKDSDFYLDNKDYFKLEFSGLDKTNIVYESLNYIDVLDNEDWIELQYVLITNQDFQTQLLPIVFYSNNNNYDFVNKYNFILYVDNLQLYEYYIERDIYSKDIRKQGLTIENYFNSSFYGDIQQLRIYDRPLNIFEVKQNYGFDKNRYDNSCYNSSLYLKK